MNKILFVVFLTILISCGYKKAEKDKYPEIPLLLLNSYSKLQIDSLPFDATYLKSSSHYYYALGRKDSANYDINYLIIFNKNFKIINKIIADIYFYTVDKNETIFILDKDNNIYKYKYPWLLRENIQKIQTDKMRDSIENKNIEPLKTKIKQNSTFNTYTYIDSLLTEVIKSKIQPGLQCGFTLGYNSKFLVLIYKDREYSISDFDNSDIEKKFGVPKCQTNAKELEEINKNLVLFDKAILGNNSSGNHFVSSFHQYGYDYFHLKIGNDSTNFKYVNNNLILRNLVQLEYPLNDKILLKEKQNEKIYLVKFKK